MTSDKVLQDRIDAFEAKYIHDQDMMFKVEARRNKLFGLWAAGVMNKSQAEAEAYAVEVIKADFAEEGYEDVLRKVDADLEAANLEYSHKDLEAKLLEFEQQAKASFP
jgi:hypothetical protein